MRASEQAPPADLAVAEVDLRTSRLWQRLVPPMPRATIWGWLGPLLIMLLGGILRFYKLADPKAVIFDETYYVPDAYSILRHGVELNHVSNVNALLLRGSTKIFAPGAEYASHPPLGKIMIAFGEWLFGLNPYGWRFAAAVVGTASILMTARIARRMTRSDLLGCIAGLLIALDGLEIVLSRTAILDIFIMFWVLAAFGMLVLDRDAARAKIAEVAGADSGVALDGDVRAGSLPGGGAWLGIRWRRVLAGFFLGCACAAKWDGIWYLIAFAGLAIAWDLGARRAAGYESWFRGFLHSDAPWLPITFGLVPLATYLASWTGWFATSAGYYRNWAAQNGNHTPIWSALDSLYQYQLAVYHSMAGLDAAHTYRSAPWSWIYLGRPISLYWATPAPRTCGGSSCAAEVLAIGTPAIWWAAMPALLFCIGWWISRRDWRPAAVVVGVAAGWLPWFWYYLAHNRTEFYYYAVAFLPFMVIGITLCLGLILGPGLATPGRRLVGAAAVGGYVLLVLVNLAYLYPVLTGKSIPYSFWHQRMWFTSWI